jgi:hypothetical protein
MAPHSRQRLNLAHGLARYLEEPVILAAGGDPKVPVSLVAGYPGFALDAGRNVRAGIARHVTPVLRASPATLVKSRAHVTLSEWPPLGS